MRKFMFLFGAMAVMISLAAQSCASKNQPDTAAEHEMTLGLVQKEIRTGMSQADVAEALGSPNIVTKDSSGKETWIYDKFARTASYKSRSAYFTILILGVSGDKGSYTSSEKTLTVVIKFNDAGQVEKLTYHASKF